MVINDTQGQNVDAEPHPLHLFNRTCRRVEQTRLLDQTRFLDWKEASVTLFKKGREKTVAVKILTIYFLRK